MNNTKESNGYFIYVSKELARDLAKDSFQVTAYTRLNTDAISSTAILDFAGKAIQNTGIVEEQVMLTEYKQTGKTVSEYIQDKMIGLVKEQLLSTDKTTSQIAYEIGFQYPQHLSRMFKRIVGMTPNKFRLQP